MIHLYLENIDNIKHMFNKQGLIKIYIKLILFSKISILLI